MNKIKLAQSSLYVFTFLCLVPFIYYYCVVDHTNRFLSIPMIILLFSYLMFTKFIHMSEIVLSVINNENNTHVLKQFTWLHVILNILLILFLYFASTTEAIVALILVVLVIVVDTLSTYWNVFKENDEEKPSTRQVADSVCYNILLMQTVVEFFDGKDTSLALVFVLVNLLVILLFVFIYSRETYSYILSVVFGLGLILVSNVTLYYTICFSIWCFAIILFYILKNYVFKSAS